jgi:hypothetical protein
MVVLYNAVWLHLGVYLVKQAFVCSYSKSTELQRKIEGMLSQEHEDSMETFVAAGMCAGLFLAMFSVLGMIAAAYRSRVLLMIYTITYSVVITAGAILSLGRSSARGHFDFYDNFRLVMNFVYLFVLCDLLKMIKKRELEQEQQEHQANMIHSSKLFV